MRKLKKSLKIIALFLSGLILMQGCSTYKTPVTLQQAEQQEKAVKIITTNDDTYKYKYIVYENGQFYGVKDNPGEDVKFPINSEEVTDVLIKGKTMPDWVLYVLIGVLAVGTILAIVVLPNAMP
ncbi:hypothetical protein ACT6NV_04435 [Robiginitalea sp. IMCC44478]|uniref:hypothetical protein n=1 Tax=Robiginitalea sp. IMCC44478 TaxID=3459122 RepID=UPI00404177A4